MVALVGFKRLFAGVSGWGRKMANRLFSFHVDPTFTFATGCFVVGGSGCGITPGASNCHVVTPVSCRRSRIVALTLGWLAVDLASEGGWIFCSSFNVEAGYIEERPSVTFVVESAMGSHLAFVIDGKRYPHFFLGAGAWCPGCRVFDNQHLGACATCERQSKCSQGCKLF